MTELVTIAGYGIAVLLGILWLTARKKSLDNLALYKDAATKFELGRERLEKNEKQLQSLEKHQSGQQAQLKALEKDLQQAQQKAAALSQKQQGEQEKTEENLRKLERQNDNLSEQNRAITEQLAEAVRDKKQALDELAKLAKQGGEQSNAQIKALQEKLGESQAQLAKMGKQLQSLKKSNEHLRSVLKKVDPDQIRKYKAKASSLEQLYQSMKNLREMAEERNQNWEKAIRVMAAHITQKDIGIDGQAPIGPLLGEALEKIGSSLVIDEHSHPEANGKDRHASAQHPDQSSTESATPDSTAEPRQTPPENESTPEQPSQV